ncbi:hypothetical protein Bca101_100897 [Brassica carinata]
MNYIKPAAMIPVDTTVNESSFGVNAPARMLWPRLVHMRAAFHRRLLLRVGNRAAGACVASSPDSDLEAFSHNPAHGSRATGFSTKRDDQLCESTVPLALRLNYYCDAGISREEPTSKDQKQRRYERLAATSQLSLCSRKSRSQSAPADTRRSARHVSGSSSPPTVDGFELGPRAQPSSQSFSGYGSILPTSLAYIVPSTRGCSPWRPAAVMSTTRRERTRSSGFSRARNAPTPRDVRCSSSRWTLPPLSRFRNSLPSSSYPEGNFGGNQLLDGSISLSPYTQVRRTICTPVSPWPPPEFLWLRPPGIVHHLSVPTGMLTLNPSRKIKVGRLCTREDPANQLPYALRVYSPADSHTCQTPWSVFQDGSNGEPTGRRPSTQMPRHAVRRVLQTTIKAATPPLA